MNRPVYALSLKQPWAALLVSGRKTIEIRSWATRVRGRILIHAARVPDRRPEAWALVDEELRTLAAFGGGVIGYATLTGCIIYRTLAAFKADRAKHLNDPEWIASVRYGFTFADPMVVPFRPLKGNVRFFTVPESEGL